MRVAIAPAFGLCAVLRQTLRDQVVHLLLLDGVYVGGRDPQGQPHFQRVKVKAPDRAELEQLVYAISERTGRYLERQGLLVRDQDNSYLALETDETGLEGVLGSSITYRIAVGPQQERKAFCLQSLPPAGSLEGSNARVARVAGFSLHAGGPPPATSGRSWSGCAATSPAWPLPSRACR